MALTLAIALLGIVLEDPDLLAYAGEGVSFLNREDDVGDPGLRTSKLSYHPVALLEKYVVTVPDPVLALPDARP